MTNFYRGGTVAVDDEDDVAPIYARVYTDFFKRDPQIYALGDIRFNKPKSLKSVGYTLALMIFYSFPVTMMVGLDKMFKNVIWAAIIFGPPLVLGSVMSKPLFHNKPLTKDIRSTVRYFSLAKTYADLQSYDNGPTVKGGMTLWLADSDCYDGPEAKIGGARRNKHTKTPKKEKKPKQKRKPKQRQPRERTPREPQVEVPKAIPLNDAARRLIAQGQSDALSQRHGR